MSTPIFARAGLGWTKNCRPDPFIQNRYREILTDPTTDCETVKELVARECLSTDVAQTPWTISRWVGAEYSPLPPRTVWLQAAFEELRQWTLHFAIANDSPHAEGRLVPGELQVVLNHGALFRFDSVWGTSFLGGPLVDASPLARICAARDSRKGLVGDRATAITHRILCVNPDRVHVHLLGGGSPTLSLDFPKPEVPGE